MHLRDDSPLFAFSFLGLVLLAAVLLVAGYGAAVGVGVIVGLLLGATAALGFIAIAARRSGRSWYSFDTSTSALSRTTMNEPDDELIQRHGFGSMRVMGVDAGTLWRVIPAGVGLFAGGARIELVAVELREHGGIATCVVQTRPPVGQVGPLLEVTVSDDAATPTWLRVRGQVARAPRPAGTRSDLRRHPQIVRRP